MRLTITTLAAVAALSAACGEDDARLRVATYNVGLAEGDIALVTQRAPLLSEALAKTDVDVLCVQEFWEAEHFTSLAEASAETLPNMVRSAPMPSRGTCTDSELIPLETCAADNCEGLCGGELTACALDRCSDELTMVSGGCGSCLQSVVIGGRCVEDIRMECLGYGRPGFLFDGAFDAGILTNLPILEEESRMLDSSLVRSSVEYARVDSPLGEVHVFCTHLASRIGFFRGMYEGDPEFWEGEQAEQIDAVLEFVEEKTRGSGRVILAGDLNTGPAIDSASIESVWPDHYARFTGAGFENGFEAQDDVACTSCPDNTFGDTGSSSELIDHVLVRNIDARASYERAWTETVDLMGTATHLSDHYGLVLTLTR